MEPGILGALREGAIAQAGFAVRAVAPVVFEPFEGSLPPGEPAVSWADDVARPVGFWSSESVIAGGGFIQDALAQGGHVGGGKDQLIHSVHQVTGAGGARGTDRDDAM